MIEADLLTKRFDGFTAVDELTITVNRGELLALLGPNGAGKTTTVRMLSAILQPTHGTARINGYDVVQEADQVRRLIG
ncbi:MAG TPA: ABC transporter ATP-binding protein, partial [Chloroflexi bacterium]|nr:ABC transporter ATP-binding protein [Chloroflexota bacterium]